MRLCRIGSRAVFWGIAGCVALATTGCSSRPSDTYQGYVEGRYVYVASPQSGRLDHLSVERGETISVGHPLFDLDDEPEAAQERQAQQLLRTSQSRFSDLRTGKRPPEVDVTRAQLTQALAQQKQSIEILQSYQAQFRAGGIPRTDLIDAQASVESNTAKVQEIRADLAVDALPARNQQMKAQAEQVAADRASLAAAAWRLQQKQISSPRQGLVFDTLYREGEWVASGSPIVELLPPENLEVRFFVPETVVGKLKAGQPILVHCDGCSADVPAAITFISPQCEYTPPVIYSNESRSKLVFMVIAAASPKNAIALHPGQPVEVALR
jgi:HlyD family secretion protein